MHFEINVALDGRHFFATHERSCTDESKMRNVLQALADRFTAEAGYTISVTKYETTGELLDVSELLCDESDAKLAEFKPADGLTQVRQLASEKPATIEDVEIAFAKYRQRARRRITTLGDVRKALEYAKLR